MKHYLSVPPSHFERAAQNAAQYRAELDEQSGTERKPTPTEGGENADTLVGAGACNTVQGRSIAPRGFEPLLPG